jgi:hypothetical protein
MQVYCDNKRTLQKLFDTLLLGDVTVAERSASGSSFILRNGRLSLQKPVQESEENFD